MTACVLTQEQLRPLIPLPSLLLTANPSFHSRSGEPLPDNKAEAGTSAGRETPEIPSLDALLAGDAAFVSCVRFPFVVLSY